MLFPALLLLAASPVASANDYGASAKADDGALVSARGDAASQPAVAVSVDARTESGQTTLQSRAPARKNKFKAALGFIVTVLGASIL